MDEEYLSAARKEIERRIAAVERILATRERLEAYVDVKVRKVLPHLHRALSKIDEGTYGYCDECDEHISTERLEAVPGATRCIACQT